MAESLADEVYKMLGYFENFKRRTRINNRGPVGGLIFLSRSGTSDIRRYNSQSGGALLATAIDPRAADDTGCTGMLEIVTELFEQAGLIGSGRQDIDAAIQELKANEAGVLAEEDILSGIHDIVAANYGVPGIAMDEARRSLELHLLGSAWSKLEDDVQTLLATAEVFWSQHNFAFGMDFAPVVVEFSRALEAILGNWLFASYRTWADNLGRASGAATLTLGQMRAAIESAHDVANGAARGPAADSLHDFLAAQGLAAYAYGDLIQGVTFVNQLRRRAAHTDIISGHEAKSLRERLLGVGTAEPMLAPLVEMLFPLSS